MTKITKKDYLRMLSEVIANSEVANKEELQGFIAKEIKLIDDRALRNSTRETAKDKENNAYIEEIYNILQGADKALTISEIQAQASEAVASLSNQRISALITKLKNEQKVVRTELKKKAYFKAI